MQKFKRNLLVLSLVLFSSIFFLTGSSYAKTEVEELNAGALNLTNVNKWHEAGYTGKGVNILVLDFNGKILDHMKDYAVLVDPEKITVDQAKHNTHVTQVTHAFAPDATIYVAPWTHSSDEITEWLKENKDLIDVINVSLTSPVTDEYDFLKELDIPVFISSGNDGDKDRQGVNFPGRLDHAIAVGAYNWMDKGVNSREVVNYSNGGEELDIVSTTNIYVQYPNGTSGVYNGTSTSSPVAAGTLANYIQWRNENNLPKLGIKEAQKFVRENTIDLYEDGFDYTSGYGLFVLPSDIPQVKTEPVKTVDDIINSQPISNVSKRKFKDVNENFWAYSSINSLAEKGIIGGYSDGTFKPNNPITRAQATIMFDNMIKYIEKNYELKEK